MDREEQCLFLAGLDVWLHDNGMSRSQFCQSMLYDGSYLSRFYEGKNGKEKEVRSIPDKLINEICENTHHSLEELKAMASPGNMAEKKLLHFLTKLRKNALTYNWTALQASDFYLGNLNDNNVTVRSDSKLGPVVCTVFNVAENMIPAKEMAEKNSVDQYLEDCRRRALDLHAPESTFYKEIRWLGGKSLGAGKWYNNCYYDHADMLFPSFVASIPNWGMLYIYSMYYYSFNKYEEVPFIEALEFYSDSQFLFSTADVSDSLKQMATNLYENIEANFYNPILSGEALDLIDRFNSEVSDV